MQNTFSHASQDDAQAWASVFPGSFTNDRRITPFEIELAQQFYTACDHNDKPLEQRSAALLVTLLKYPTPDHPQGYAFYYVPFNSKLPLQVAIKRHENATGELTVIALDTSNSKPFCEQWPYGAGTVQHPSQLAECPTIATPTVVGTGAVNMFNRSPL